MDSMAGYDILDRIYESQSTHIFKACDENHSQSWIIKILKEDNPSPQKLFQLKNEYETLCRLDIPGVIKAKELKKYNGSYMLILEDIGAISLDRMKNGFNPDIGLFLDIALKITKAFGLIHGKNVIHQNLNPSNIIYNADSGQLQIIDFGLSAIHSKTALDLVTPGIIEGNLSYISPEQTGRMNCSIDFRTDFYSLGIIFYQLLARSVPFKHTDPMKLIHSHIAKQAPILNSVEPRVPKTLSEIIMKLIQKNPDDRYQDSLSIMTDLIKFRQQYGSTGKIHDVSANKEAYSPTLSIPKQLYGRKKELSKLLSVSSNAMEGEKEIAIISGYTGIGKTKLIQEFREKFTIHDGYVISGKFDQFEKQGQYNFFIHAVSKLIHRILLEDEFVFNAFKEKLKKALGDNAQLIIGVIPELESIIGAHPVPVELQMMEEHHRFQYVFQNFIKVFSNKDHPLILILDDLQWADEASFELLKLILLSDDIKHICFIGAYRENEVEKNHPCKKALHQIEQKGVRVNHINLAPLKAIRIDELICDTLHCSLKKAEPLCKLVYSKTRGNPFFVNEFLTSIHKSGFLEYDMECSTWKWDVEKIREISITDNVADLIKNRIQSYSIDTIKLLTTAACMGATFDIKILSKVCGMPLEKCLTLVDHSVKEGIVVHLKEHNRFFDLTDPLLREQIYSYKFLHDSFPQTAYSLLEESEKQLLHWKIGSLMLKNCDRENKKPKSIEIVNHLNKATPFIPDDFGKTTLVQLNIEAAKKSKSVCAYGQAFQYITGAISLLGTNTGEKNSLKVKSRCWEKDYALCLYLYEQAVEIAFLKGDYKQMHGLSEQADINIKSLADKVKLLEIKIQYLYTKNRLDETIVLALGYLKKIGIRLHHNPSILHVGFEIAKTKFLLKNKNIAGLVNLPRASDPKTISFIKILSSIGLPAFTENQNLLPILICKSLQFNIKNGNSTDSIFLYAGYGMIMASIKGSVDTAYEFGCLAVDLLNKLNAKQVKAKIMTTVYGIIMPAKKPLKSSLMPLLEGYLAGFEYGDHQYAGTCSELYCRLSLYAGINLDKIDQDLKNQSRQLAKRDLILSLSFMKTTMQTVYNLKGKNLAAHKFDGPIFFYENTSNHLVLFVARLFNTMLLYLFEKKEKAIDSSNKARKYLKQIRSMVDLAMFYFYDSLSILSVAAEKNEREKRKYLHTVKKNQKKLKYYMTCAPENYEHKYFLVEAESYRVKNEQSKAQYYYAHAIDGAKHNEYLNEEGLANELTAKYFLSKLDLNQARMYFASARQCYQKWGAHAKVEHMRINYSGICSHVSDAFGKTRENMDRYFVLKASNAISKEIEPGKLMTTLIGIILENSGAQHAYLILKSDNQLKIEAFARTTPARTEVCQSVLIDKQCDQLPVSMVYATIRSGECIVIDNASKSHRFKSDNYIIKNKPLSVMCIPLKSESLVKGVLYLENNLLKGAFTREHLLTLDILLPQVVISIEKAVLYEDLKKEIDKKEKAVKKISKQHKRLTEMSTELAEVEEKERNIIAQDLHDSVTQTLVLSILKLRSIIEKNPNKKPGKKPGKNPNKKPDKNLATLSDVHDYLQQTVATIRSLTYQLSPPILNDFGIEAALEALCRDMRDRYGLIVLFYNKNKKPVVLNKSSKVTLYRIVRELLINISKHAKIDMADILIYTEKKHLYIEVKDNGIGFNKKLVDQKKMSFGLSSIYQRIKAINGGIQIDSQIGKGTKIVLSIDCS